MNDKMIKFDNGFFSKMIRKIRNFFFKNYPSDNTNTEKTIIEDSTQSKEKNKDTKNILNNNFQDNGSVIDIKSLLKMIGCKKEIFKKVSNFDDINIENFQKILQFLDQFHYSKLELPKILNENTELLYKPSDDIIQNVKNISGFIQDPLMIKQIIYQNPFVLTNTYDMTEMSSTFSKFEVNTELQKYIIAQNSDIISLDKDIIQKSLEKIREMCKIQKKFVDIITYMPELVGMIDEKIINEYIES